MLTLILLPLTLAVEVFLLPWRLIAAMMRSRLWLGFVVLFGFMSLFGGAISLIGGLLKGLLPFLLVAAGVYLLVWANKKEPAAREEAFESFYARRGNSTHA